MQTFPVKDDFPDGFYDEIAHLVVAFGRVEYFIKLCIKSLLGQGFNRGMVEAESRRQFSTLCKKARQEAEKKLGQNQSQLFCGLIDQAEALADYRNDTIHAYWTTDSKTQPLRIRLKSDKSTKSVNWDRSRVVLVSELQQERLKIEQLFDNLQAERDTWSVSAPST
jgi:hypothetical protein